MSVIEVGLSCLSGSNMWMGSGGRWAAEAGAEDTQYSFGWPCSTHGVHAGTLPSPVSLQTCTAWGSWHASQQGTAFRSGPMVWCTTLASQRRPTSTADGHNQAFLPKAVPTVCCLSLSWSSTCIHAHMHGQWLKHGLLPALGHHRDGKWSTFVPVWGHGCEGPGGMSRERKRARMAFFSREMMCGRTLPCLGCLGTSKQRRLWETGL